MSNPERDPSIAERDDPSAGEASAVEEVASGRSPATPFVLLGSVALTVWSAAALVIGAALVVWWLA